MVSRSSSTVFSRTMIVDAHAPSSGSTSSTAAAVEEGHPACNFAQS